MASRILFNRTKFNLHRVCQHVTRNAPILSAVDPKNDFNFRCLTRMISTTPKWITKPKSVPFLPIIGIVYTQPEQEHPDSVPTRYDIVPGKHPLIALKTQDGSPEAVFDIPKSGLKNFNLAIEQGHLSCPKFTAVIANVPDEINLTISYEDLKQIPLLHVVKQTFNCKPEDGDKISVYTNQRDAVCKKIGIPTVEKYFEKNIKRDGKIGESFKSTDNYKELYKQLWQNSGTTRDPILSPDGVPMSIIKESKDHDWYFRDLPDLLGIVRSSLTYIEGICAPKVYFGVRGIVTPYRWEEDKLFLVNIMPSVIGLPEQGEKLWISYHLDDIERLESLIKKEHPYHGLPNISKCIYIKSLEALAENGIRFQVLRQKPKSVVITYGPHSEMNTGTVVNESLNVASPLWIGMYLRFIDDQKLVKPEVPDHDRYEISKIQLSNNYSRGGIRNSCLGDDPSEIYQEPIPQWKETDKMRHYHLISQILLHKHQSSFAFLEGTLVETRRIIQAVVLYRLLNGTESIANEKYWKEIRNLMGAYDKVKPKRIFRERMKVGYKSKVFINDNYLAELENVIKAHPEALFQDVEQFKESKKDTLAWAKKMTKQSNTGLKPLIDECKRFCEIPFENSHELFTIYRDCMKEQRKTDPAGTWASIDGDTDFGRLVRAKLEDYKAVIQELESTEPHNATPPSTPSPEMPILEDKAFDPQTRSSPQKASPTPHSPQKANSSLLTHSSHQSEPEMRGSSHTQKSLSRKDLEKQRRRSLIINFVFGMTEEEKNFALNMLKGDESESVEQGSEGNLNESELPYPEREEEFAKVSEIEEEVELLPESDEEVQTEKEIIPDSDEEGIEMQETEKDINLEGNEGEKIVELLPESDEEVQFEQEIIPESDEEDIDMQGIGDELESEFNGVKRGTIQTSKTEPPTKPNPSKCDIIVPEKLDQSTIYSNSNYIEQLVKHYRNPLDKSAYPELKLNSISGLLFETLRGKTKTIVQNPHLFSKLFQLLFESIGSADFPSLLVSDKCKRKQSWGVIINGSSVFSPKEKIELLSTIMVALNVDDNNMGIEYKRLNAILRILLSVLSRASGMVSFPDPEKQIKWLQGTVGDTQSIDTFMSEFKIPQRFEKKFPGIKNEYKWDENLDKVVGYLFAYPDHIVGLEEELAFMDQKDKPREVALKQLAEKHAQESDEKYPSPPKKRAKV